MDPNDQTAHRVYADWLEEHAPDTVSQEVLDRLRNSTGPLHVGRDQQGNVIIADTHLKDDQLGPGGPFHSDLNNHIKKFVRNLDNPREGWVVTYRPMKDPDGHWYWMIDSSVSGSTPNDHPVKLPMGVTDQGPTEGDRIGPITHERLEKTHLGK
jgi:hypothetical protein